MHGFILQERVRGYCAVHTVVVWSCGFVVLALATYLHGPVDVLNTRGLPIRSLL